MVPRFGEFCYCSSLPLLPGFACSIHATWGPPFRLSPVHVNYSFQSNGGYPCPSATDVATEECQMPACSSDDTSASCPKGYILKPGDVPGWGTISGRHSTATVEDCTALCDQNDRCCSIEWSPTEKLCNLNKECGPSQGLFKDYLLCIADATSRR